MYTVYGRSKAKAATKAEKDTSWYVKGKPQTLAEYNERLEAASQANYDTMRASKISPIYSSIEEAKKYIELCERADSAKDMFVMRMSGRTLNPKKNKYRVEWSAAGA